MLLLLPVAMGNDDLGLAMAGANYSTRNVIPVKAGIHYDTHGGKPRRQRNSITDERVRKKE